MVFFNTIAMKSREVLDITATVLFLLAALPLLYLLVIFGHWICSRSGVGQSIKSRMQSVCRRAHGTKLEESLPDDGGQFSMANNSEKFSDQAYSSIKNEERHSVLAN